MARWFGCSIFVLALVACGPSGRNNHGPCSGSAMQCVGNELETCQDGTFQDSMTCPNACSDMLGCVLCVPGTGTCNGNISTACNADGSGYDMVTCDPVEGVTCDQTMGVCTGTCSPAALSQSYIGCDYYPTVTGNIVGDNFDFAVAISNTSGDVAMITIDGGALTSPMMVTVPANSLLVQKLPWQQALKMCNDALTPETGGCDDIAPTEPGIVAKGAYHLRSNNPVTVYQFNSLEYSIDGGVDFSYSNDASLMLPTNVWRKDYFAAALGGLAGVNPSEMAITAMQDGTMVTIKSRATTDAAPGIQAFAIGTPQTIMLNQGDVVELTSNGDPAEVDVTDYDFTGSEITSSAPVQVISGHYCADVPDDPPVAACDHMEESMFGVDALSSTYIVNAPAVTTEPAGKVEVIRVIATQPGTTLTYNPAQPGAPTTITNAGDFIAIENNSASFMITANQKVMVAQYMEGQDADGAGTGDPAMALAVPVEQFRTSYLFHAPISYDSNYVDVTAPTGATVMLDGMPVTFNAIGATGYSLGRVNPLTAGPNGDGSHNITGDMPFGITVYGYGQYTSYWYAGGLDLSTIVIAREGPTK